MIKKTNKQICLTMTKEDLGKLNEICEEYKCSKSVAIGKLLKQYFENGYVMGYNWADEKITTIQNQRQQVGKRAKSET